MNKVLVGNKWDMEAKRAVSKEKGEALASEFGIPFFETSAKRDVNVEDAFYRVARDVTRRLKQNGQKPQPHSTGNVTLEGKRGKSSCC